MPVIADVPLPWRRPVKVIAPAPPEPTARAFPRVREPRVASCEKRFVELAVVEKRFVVVAFVMMVFPRVEAPVMLSVATCRPLKRVDVALATKLPTFWMERMEPGVEGPTPTSPLESMWKGVEVALAVEVEIENSGAVLEESAARESLAKGELVPMPTFVPSSKRSEFANVPLFHFER